MIYKSYLLEKDLDLIDKDLILFFGENLGLKNDFKNKIKLKYKTNEIYNYHQEEILKNEQSFFNEINNISLFENKKVYLIDQVNDKILEIIKEVKTKIDAQKIYLFADILDKKSKIRNHFEKSSECAAVACYADNEIGIKKIILDKLKGFKGLSTENINLILENSNLDRSKLKNELDKILIYFTSKELLKNELEIILDVKINDNFNNLRDEALNGNKYKTNKLLSDTILESEKNIFYLASINQSLNKLSQISELSKTQNIETSINMIKPPVFWKDKPIFMAQSRKWNQYKIKKILNQTYDLELKIKTSTLIDKNTLLKKLIIDICDLANAS